MNKLVKKFLLFSLPVLIAMVAGEYFLTLALHKSRYKTFVVWNDLFNGKIDSDVVVYGSSRARTHIDPRIIEDSLHMTAYNLGLDAYSFDVQLSRHKILFLHNRQPKYIIHSLDFATLTRSESLYTPEQFLPYLNDSIVHSAVDHFGVFDWWDYHLPLVRYFGETTSIVNGVNVLLRPGHNVTDRYRGFKSSPRRWTGEFEAVQQRLGTLEVKLDPATMAAFESYLREMRKKNIPVILVYTPEYIDGQNFVVNRSEVMYEYQRLSREYGVPFLDYSDDPICRDRSLFYNATHLNSTGAELFSRKLMADIKKYVSH